MRKLVFVLFICSLSVGNLWAQSGASDEVYEKGDVQIRVGVGALFPLYVHAFNFSDFTMSSMKTGFSIGLGFDYYLSNNLKIGGSASFGSITNSSKNYSFLVPVVTRISWEFHTIRFDFPVGVDVGLLFNKYRTLFAINFLVRPHAGVFFNITRSWSIGIDTTFWIVPQVVWDDLPKSRVGTFVEVMIAGRYRL
ncbi:TP0733 family outer membrane beta-barrel protein [Entomospira culicis]|uniref:Outer membrane protein beta-barrel domain-containing protein n=1 Tax=Entomospira culicis TaxID=2719989 RepID=A0A968GHG2_9SPIO|nr:hypothetical protein [Entomospira culicis]NIZ18844.1 hypothetical protein [Entomospira culicis]NIZ69059.1 hypothetical protein [Entomospira culicis]WDI37647.1 hypothetical protein PVA46_02365 [Entomospira culicis]WDI39275.1 hypothetical protein PVA47_02370 [Entomospira culicis]